MTTPDATIEVPMPDDASIGLELPTVTDEFMRERLGQSQSYTLMMLRKTPAHKRPDADPIVWEHGRRNFKLREAGLMPIVCPVRDDSEWAGICIFTVEPERASEIMSEDPGVKAGIFAYEVHPISGFPGSRLPDEGRGVL
jgi:hypothetical protein